MLKPNIIRAVSANNDALRRIRNLRLLYKFLITKIENLFFYDVRHRKYNNTTKKRNRNNEKRQEKFAVMATNRRFLVEIYKYICIFPFFFVPLQPKGMQSELNYAKC